MSDTFWNFAINLHISRT